MSPVLLHMTTRNSWDEALATGRYAAPSLAVEGFIHLSTPEQVHLPATYLFRGRADIVLLYVDPDRLDATVLWEPGDPADPDGMRFPHLYGDLPTAAVRAVEAYRPNPDGSFGTPPPEPPAHPGDDVPPPDPVDPATSPAR